MPIAIHQRADLIMFASSYHGKCRLAARIAADTLGLCILQHSRESPFLTDLGV